MRTFVIRAKASPRWAIGELAKLLEHGDVENAGGLAWRLVPFWTEVAQREESPAFLERTLGVADRLDSPERSATRGTFLGCEPPVISKQIDAVVVVALASASVSR